MKNKKQLLKGILSFVGIAIIIIIIAFIANKAVNSKPSLNEEVNYDKKTFDKVHEINYSVSPDFTSSYNNDSSNHTYYNDEKNGIFCWFYFKKYEKDNTSFEKWFRDESTPRIVSGYYTSSKISKIVNNNVNVYYREGVDEFGFRYFYGFETTNYYYLLDYYISDEQHGDRNNHICYTTKEQLLSTITLK